MERIDWHKLELFEGSDEGGAFDYYGCPFGKEWFVQRLQEFARTGGMDGVFFARIGAAHEDEEDASTWGPQSPEQVDWTGFPVTADGTLCRMVSVSDTGTYDLVGEIEDWDEVRAAVDEVHYVSGLLGWSPYTALYVVRQHDEALHYMVAERIYGAGELAQALGWTSNRFAMARSRGQVPRPTFEVKAGPVWTHHDVAEFIARRRGEQRAANLRPPVHSYDHAFAEATARLIHDLEEAGHTVECPVTGAVIVDGIEIPRERLDGFASVHEGDAEATWDYIREQLGR